MSTPTMAEVWVAAERRGTPYHRIESTRSGLANPVVTVRVMACGRHSPVGHTIHEAVAIVRGYKPCTRCFTEGVVR